MLAVSLTAVALTFVVFKLLLIIEPTAIQEIWMIENLSGVLIGGIPIEEYIFAAALGFGTPFFYEIVTGHIPEWK